MSSQMMIDAIQHLIDTSRGDYASLMNIQYKIRNDIPITDHEEYYIYNNLG